MRHAAASRPAPGRGDAARAIRAASEADVGPHHVARSVIRVPLEEEGALIVADATERMEGLSRPTPAPLRGVSKGRAVTTC